MVTGSAAILSSMLWFIYFQDIIFFNFPLTSSDFQESWVVVSDNGELPVNWRILGNGDTSCELQDSGFHLMQLFSTCVLWPLGEIKQSFLGGHQRPCACHICIGRLRNTDLNPVTMTCGNLASEQPEKAKYLETSQHVTLTFPTPRSLNTFHILSTYSHLFDRHYS